MVRGKCSRRGCNFEFDDAEYNEDAVEKLRAHHRTQHRPKQFIENDVGRAVEIYNYTIEEAIAMYAGDNWREKLANGRLDSRHITRACSHVCQYPWQYHRDLIAEVQALSLEHGAAIADPYANVQEPVDLMARDGF